MRWFDKDIEIRYADTDQMGVVHHGVYPLYCEVGRTHACAALGRPYHELEKEGIFLMVAEMSCRYKSPARYGEPIYVRSAVSSLSRRLISFGYEIRNKASGLLLFTGTTKHLVTRKTEGAMSLPAPYLEKLSRGLTKA